MAPRKNYVRRTEAEADTSIWKEALYGAELLLLHASPIYYGLGVPQGTGSAVVLIPGFLGTDQYLLPLHGWLERIGYRPYLSDIGVNAECPNLLIQHRLNKTIEKALRETGRKIDLIGHSLGGIIARSVASQRPDEIASVITLASPFRGTVLHQVILRAAEQVRQQILEEHGPRVLPDCYTARCTCEFLNHLRRDIPDLVSETAIYTRDDGVVDWRYCRTGKPEADFEVPGTHIGLVFNPTVYATIAQRLAESRQHNNGPVHVSRNGHAGKNGAANGSKNESVVRICPIRPNRKS
jgi:pimeloyl-ACP methyl ester carboxylesterase